jgi:hypothetical protein
MLLLLAGVMAFFAVRFVRNRIADYTDAAPMKLPKVEMAEAEFKQLDDRVKSFGDALQQGKPTEPLVLTEREVNALLAKQPEAKEFADKFYVSLEGDQVKGRVSLPLPHLGWLASGRYLNGDATFNVSLENGVLIVTAREVQVKGLPLPDSVMSQLRLQNLAKDVYKDPKNAEAIRKFESVQVREGTVIIKARLAEQPASAKPPGN